MTTFVHIAMIGWLPFTLGLFAVLSPRRAVLVAYIGGWLLLPMFAYMTADIPDYTKYGATAIPVLIGSLLFDSRTWASVRPRLIDLPMTVFCLCPMVTAVLMGYGVMAGISRVLTHLFMWGIPYAIGRAYFTEWRHVRELAVGVLIGVLVYLPLVWYEVRMSPQLHRIVYGYHQHPFVHVIRYGGYRPRVFMQSGLMLATWLSSGTVIGLWLWRSSSLRSLRGVSMAVTLPVLAGTTILSRSGNGIVCLATGAAVLFATQSLRSRIPLLMLTLAVPTYIALRATSLWDGQELISAISFDADRAGSLSCRMRQEDVYTAQAWKRPLFGWGGAGMIPTDDQAKRLTRGNDALWIITFGLYGLTSLVSVFASLLLPALVLVKRVPANIWTSSVVAPLAALVTVVTLFAIDCLFNYMPNPVYVLAVGGTCGVARYAPLPGARADTELPALPDTMGKARS